MLHNEVERKKENLNWKLFSIATADSSPEDKDNLEQVHALLDEGADVNGKISNFNSILFETVMRTNNLNIARLLLERGADVNYKTKSGHTALMMTCMFMGDLSNGMCELLLKHGATVNDQSDEGETPLMMAARRNIEKVSKLREYGADLYLSNKRGETALSIAKKWGSQDIIQFLEKEIYTNETKEMQVSFKDQFEEKSIHIMDDYLKPELPEGKPFFEAACNNELEKVRAFLDAKPELIDYEDVNGNTALLLVAKNKNEFNMNEMVDLLLSRGANIKHRNRNDDMALNLAVLFFKPQTGKLYIKLLENGADVNHSNNWSETPLLTAIRIWRWDIISTLLEWGADVSLAARDVAADNEYEESLEIDEEKVHQKEIEKMESYFKTQGLFARENGDQNKKEHPLDIMKEYLRPRKSV
jgi:ankyrin